MRKSSLLGVMAGAAIVAVASNSRASVIYSDNFDGTAGVLSGRAPDVATGLDGGLTSATWTSDATTSANPDQIWTATGGTYNGTIGSTSAVLGSLSTGADGNLITNASLPFTPASGTIYDFHLSIETSSVGASGNWIGLAYGIPVLNHTGGGPSSALSNDGVYGLLIAKGSGLVQTFGGEGTGNAESSPTITAGQYNNFDVYLNTTGTSWVESWSVNGTPLAGTYTFTANPALGNIIFGSDHITGAVSNFSLTDTNVPEPASLGIIGLGAFGLLRRRARNT